MFPFDLNPPTDKELKLWERRWKNKSTCRHELGYVYKFTKSRDLIFCMTCGKKLTKMVN